MTAEELIVFRAFVIRLVLLGVLTVTFGAGSQILVGVTLSRSPSLYEALTLGCAIGAFNCVILGLLSRPIEITVRNRQRAEIRVRVDDLLEAFGYELSFRRSDTFVYRCRLRTKPGHYPLALRYWRDRTATLYGPPLIVRRVRKTLECV